MALVVTFCFFPYFMSVNGNSLFAMSNQGIKILFIFLILP